MRNCLSCRRLTQGSYCKACAKGKGHQSAEYRRNRQIVLTAHLKRYGNRCLGDERHPPHPCTTLQVDHIKPLSQGGTNHISNLRAMCRRGNIGRDGGSRSPRTEGRTIQLRRL